MTWRAAWQRFGALAGGVALLVSVAGAGYAVDAWAGARVAEIVTEHVPEAVEAEIGDTLEEIRDALRESRDEDALLREEVRALRRSLLAP